ncbi:MAG TPA: class I SAM-dependent methyltransferase [Solirubrobacterales bacterium]|nr:class I SAM-dependent methyltransferase [Solirubrobacterales bacterium]
MATIDTATEVGSHYRLGDYLLGIEGLAILRAAQRRQFDRLAGRRAEVDGIVRGYENPPLFEQRDLPEVEVDAGYTSWSETYDHPTELDPDPILALEGPVMRKLIDGFSDGPVLDAGCGTGRHTAYLAEAGYDVIGVDANEGMLSVARAKLPKIEFRHGDVTGLPVDDQSFTSITCGLVLGHLPDVAPAISELARALQPGGRVVISVPHPFITSVLGWRAPIIDSEGNACEVPEYGHGHGEYIEAFGRAGLTVSQCIEPRLTAEQARWRPDADPDEENPFGTALEDALAGQPGAMVWVVDKG